MTETSGMFGVVGDVRYYNQPQWLQLIKDFRANGYVKSAGSELAVSQHSPTLMGVDVAAGEAWVQGNWYLNDAANAISVPAADPVYPRIDRVILRNNITGSRKITAQVLAGTPAAVPVAPALTRTNDTWDLCIAEIAVAAGATTIVTGNITDKRANATLCGIASPVSVRVADIITGNAFDMLTYGLTGVTDPSGNNDGTTLNYLKSKTLTYPTGIPFWYAGATVPAGFLECLGQEVSRTTYSALFAVMGTSFGVGDGSTTFNLPDARGRSIFGYDGTQTEFNTIGKTGGEKSHVLVTAELPVHTHTALGVTGTGFTAGGNAHPRTITSYNVGDTGGGLAHQNLQPYIVMKLIVWGA